MSRPAIAERLRATIGESRLREVLQAYKEPRGAILPLVILLRDEGVDIDADVTAWIAHTCEVSAAIVLGALSGFSELSRDLDSIAVCEGLTCRLMGASSVRALLQERLGEDRVCTSVCQNACSSAPTLQVHGVLYGGLHEESLNALARRLERPASRA